MSGRGRKKALDDRGPESSFGKETIGSPHEDPETF